MTEGNKNDFYRQNLKHRKSDRSQIIELCSNIHIPAASVKHYFSPNLYKVEECGNTTFLTTTHKGKMSILPLERNENGNREYIKLSTGEIKEMNEKATSRTDNIRTLKKSLARLSKLVDTNINEFPAFLVFTLTYKLNMIDTKRLYSDFGKFWKRLVYQVGEDAASDYIAAAEPQARGAWHFHVVLFQKKKRFIKWKLLEQIWGHGFVDIDKRKKATESDSVGKYLTAYLSHLPTDEMEEYAKNYKGGNGQHETFTDDKGKRYLKGLRLNMYPAKFRFFRWSKGIKQPKKETKHLSYDQLEKYGSLVSHKQFFYEVEGELRMGEGFIFKKKVNPKFTALTLLDATATDTDGVGVAEQFEAFPQIE